MLKPKAIKALVGIAISVIALAVIVRMVEWHEVLEQMKHANFMPVLWVTGLWIIHFYIRAYRWKFFLPGGRQIRLQLLFHSIMLGNFATFILPLRAGEFIRPLFLSRNTRLSFSTCFVSVIIERFFDLCTVLALFAYVTFIIPGLPSWTRDGAFGLCVLAGGIFCFIIIGTFLPDQTRALIRFFTKKLPHTIGEILEKFLGDFIGGASELKSVSSLVMIFLLTMIAWALNIAIFQLFTDVLSIQSSFSLAITLTVLVALAVAAPSAPGFLGIFQAGCIAAFSLFGLSKETATAYSLLNHANQFILFIGFGIYILLHYGISLKELRTATEKA